MNKIKQRIENYGEIGTDSGMIRKSEHIYDFIPKCVYENKYNPVNFVERERERERKERKQTEKKKHDLRIKVAVCDMKLDAQEKEKIHYVFHIVQYVVLFLT